MIMHMHMHMSDLEYICHVWTSRLGNLEEESLNLVILVFEFLKSFEFESKGK